ncbi:MAG: prepilin-type N-terminal cleavage/methylation domain-containing protein [Bacteriovoracaceae bacterium]|nr:prepilin-type N-terminal cleavage/methylation domain-containing protein [Bacteriovoracaceae bacterium]
MMNKSTGFSLVEVMVTVAILGIAALGYLNFTKTISQGERKVNDGIKANNVFRVVVNELMKDNRYIMGKLDDGSDHDLIFNEDISNPQYLGRRCYNRSGIRVPEAQWPADVNDCSFLIKFFKIYAVNKWSTVYSLPVSQFHIKIEYDSGMLNSKRRLSMIIRPIFTSVVHY